MDLPASDRSETAHLVLERRDSPSGQGFAYVAETDTAPPITIATSATFYPDLDLEAGESALRELIVRLDGDGWQQQPRRRLTVIGQRFRRR
jgi:hypothetical protein